MPEPNFSAPVAKGCLYPPRGRRGVDGNLSRDRICTRHRVLAGWYVRDPANV